MARRATLRTCSIARSSVNVTNATNWGSSVCVRSTLSVLTSITLRDGTHISLNTKNRHNTICVCCTHADVACVEDRTFICSQNKDEAGPTNNWEDPVRMKRRLTELFTGSMRGRTMYVVPY